MAEYDPRSTAQPSHSSVASAATSQTILAANPRRHGATIVNTDTNALYLRMGTTDATTTTGYHVRLVQYAYYELPYGYSGAITGIWDADGAGAANVCEFI
jgi:hypothetical protein